MKICASGLWMAGWILGLSLTACADWQISGDHKLAYLERDTLDDTHHVQPWGVDAVTGATRKREQAAWIGETNLTASHVEAAASRTLGVRILAGKDIDTPYRHPRLSNLLLAWHGAAGSLEAGYILNPLSWGRGLLIDRTVFSGGRTVIDWGNSGRSEGFWTDTLEDSKRYRYYELSLAGFRQVVKIPHGEIGVGVVDTSRAKTAVFPKVQSARGTFTQVDLEYAGGNRTRWYAEAVYARLLDDRVKDTRAYLLGVEYGSAVEWQVLLRGWYLGPAYNPPTGYYNVYGDEEGNACLTVPFSVFGGNVRINPGWGWKQRAAVNYWVPQGEVQWYWPEAGTTVKAYERAEQPVARWGAEDHWEYTGASLTWESPWAWALTGRWEKIYNGFIHTKLQQWSAEITVRY